MAHKTFRAIIIITLGNTHFNSNCIGWYIKDVWYNTNTLIKIKTNMGLLYAIAAIILGIIAATLITFIAIALTYSIEKLEDRFDSRKYECEDCIDILCTCDY